MPREILQSIIDDFSFDKFNVFFRESCAVYKEVPEKLPVYNKDIFTNAELLGFLDFGGSTKNMAVVGVKVKKDLTERASKKAQYDFAKNLLKQEDKYEAGIFIFYDALGNFRFSLIYPQYNGRHRIWNNFRRFTYFVSKEFTNKTFKQRIGECDFSSLEKIKDAFSVEKVTKEFYLEYHKLFESLLSELSKNYTFLNEALRNNLNTENFAKKLLGQIVFLYFLQRKCWLGAKKEKQLNKGDKNFFGNLFAEKYRKYNNFFNDILEPLFYDALNKKSDKAGNFYRDYFNCQIPFLNGGLFESEYKWKETTIFLDDKIFENIFEVFDRYNFTVEEESPDDKEIAIDPEMLGKVFENLLSENLRKGKGTYYTPREIVYYMCQESLINYLVTSSNINNDKIRKLINRENILTDKELSEINEEIELEKVSEDMVFFEKNEAKQLDELLKNIKVCDPACGSGAFLVGMLNLIIKLRIYLQKTPDSHLIPQKTEYELKKEAIQNCIYGVDIDPGAIEIAKLRLWLSLVVDYELKDIEPLPNLDYKIMQGNSLLEELVLGDTSIKLFDSKTRESKKMKNLLEEDKQTDLFGESDRQKAIVEKLSKLHKEYFGINELEEKKKKKFEINKIEQDLIESSIKKEVEKLGKENKNIGNYLMPGVGMTKKDADKFQKNLSKQSQIMNILDEFKKTGVKPFFLWRLYFADVFEKGGFDVVIANPPYVDSERMTKETPKLRKVLSEKYITAKGNWDLYIPFWELGINILSTAGIASFITPNKWLSIKYGEELRNLLSDHIYKIGNCDQIDVFEAGNSPIIVFAKNKQKSKNVLIDIFQTDYSVSNLAVVSIINATIPNWGWMLSQNIKLILKISNQIAGKKYYHCENPFTVSEAYEVKEFIEDLGEEKFYNPKKYFKFINTGTIDKYLFLWGKKKTTYLKKKYFFPVIQRNVFSEKFPRRYKQMNAIKIVISGMRYFECVLDSKTDIIAGKSTVILKSNSDYKVILGILNSKLISFYIKESFGSSGIDGGINFTADLVENLPFPELDRKNKKEIECLVDQILKKKKDNPEADVGELEKTIDQLVYKFYNLTKEEIKIIENN
ncbi:MAG: DNA methyltransferase [Candidatus Kuenenbacteria bacterium]